MTRSEATTQPTGRHDCAMLDIAREYIAAGISIIPIRLDGSKAPACGPWKAYQHRRATDDELEKWFSRPAGIGIIAGIISGGLEIIDFDAGDLFEPWRLSVQITVAKLPIIETPSGGYHVFYRCQEISGNHKIACDPTRQRQTLIETRGEGGYVVGAGSPPSAHSTNQPYVQISGPPLPNIPVIAKSERLVLWRAARSFDRARILEQARLNRPTSRSKRYAA